MKRWIGITLVALTLAGCGGSVGEPRKTIENRDPGFQPTKRWDPGFESTSGAVDEPREMTEDWNPGFQPTKQLDPRFQSTEQPVEIEGVVHAGGITQYV